MGGKLNRQESQTWNRYGNFWVWSLQETFPKSGGPTRRKPGSATRRKTRQAFWHCGRRIRRPWTMRRVRRKQPRPLTKRRTYRKKTGPLLANPGLQRKDQTPLRTMKPFRISGRFIPGNSGKILKCGWITSPPAPFWMLCGNPVSRPCCWRKQTGWRTNFR